MPGGTTRRRSKNAAAAAAPAGAKRKLDNEAEARTRALYRWNTAQLHFELEQAYELRCAFARALETAQWADALPDPLRSALDATRSALNAVCGAECALELRRARDSLARSAPCLSSLLASLPSYHHLELVWSDERNAETTTATDHTSWCAPKAVEAMRARGLSLFASSPRSSAPGKVESVTLLYHSPRAGGESGRGDSAESPRPADADESGDGELSASDGDAEIARGAGGTGGLPRGATLVRVYFAREHERARSALLDALPAVLKIVTPATHGALAHALLSLLAERGVLHFDPLEPKVASRRKSGAAPGGVHLEHGMLQPMTALDLLSQFLRSPGAPLGEDEPPAKRGASARARAPASSGSGGSPSS